MDRLDEFLRRIDKAQLVSLVARDDEELGWRLSMCTEPNGIPFPLAPVIVLSKSVSSRYAHTYPLLDHFRAHHRLWGS